MVMQWVTYNLKTSQITCLDTNQIMRYLGNNFVNAIKATCFVYVWARSGRGKLILMYSWILPLKGHTPLPGTRPCRNVWGRPVFIRNSAARQKSGRWRSAKLFSFQTSTQRASLYHRGLTIFRAKTNNAWGWTKCTLFGAQVALNWQTDYQRQNYTYYDRLALIADGGIRKLTLAIRRSFELTIIICS